MATPGRELSSINFAAMLGGPLKAVVDAQAQSAMTSVNFIKSVGFRPALDGSGNVIPGQVGDPIYVTFKYPKEVAPFRPAIPAAVVQIAVTDGGAGYQDSNPPSVTIAPPPGAGSAATARATVQGGSVVSIELQSNGSGYTAAPTVTIAAPPAGAGSKTATANAIFRPHEPARPAEFQEMRLEVPILTMLPIPFIRIEETTIDFNAKINSVEETKTDETFKIDATLDATVTYPPVFAIATVNLKVNTSYQKSTSAGSKVDRTYSMAVHIRAVQDEMPAGTERILGILEDSIRSVPVQA
ncbi:MAG: DUF2589 domain-containing protein [Gammaproteobacteria bacterium]|jgi:hypothetical protein|nr:DUF2589 domain-containing protein [Gammaproteobacteria bacterium]